MVEQGTFGELLVILRLLEHQIQASFTLKDSGNDLLAVKGDVFKAIQVKSSVRGIFDHLPPISKKYHLLALVSLRGEQMHLDLNRSKIYLLTKEEIDGHSSISENQLEGRLLEDRVNDFFP